MHILLIETVAQLGGAQRSFLDHAIELQKNGFTLLTAVPAGPLYDELKKAQIPLAVIPGYRLRRNPLYWCRVVKRFMTTKAIGRIADAFNATVIHANSLDTSIAAAPLAKHYPLVCHVRDLKFSSTTLRRATANAMRIIACSDAVDAYLAELLHGTPRSRLRRVVNGIDTERLALRPAAAAKQSLGIPQECRVVAMAAHLAPWKRHDIFLQMAATLLETHQDLRFIMAGRDLLHENKAYCRTIRQLVHTLNLSGKLLWLEDTDDISDVFNAADVFVHTSMAEPFGRVLCEAMALGKPVVALYSKGPAAIISHNVNGILVNAPNPTQLATAVSKLLTDPKLARAYGEAGRQRVAELFSVKRSTAEIIKVYRGSIADFSMN